MVLVFHHQLDLFEETVLQKEQKSLFEMSVVQVTYRFERMKGSSIRDSRCSLP